MPRRRHVAELPVADFNEPMRSFRIVDGADEVQKRTLTRTDFEVVDEAVLEALTQF